MKKFGKYILLAALILVIVLAGNVTQVAAGGADDGHWHGSPDIDGCWFYNDCYYTFELCIADKTVTSGSHDPDIDYMRGLAEDAGLNFGACASPPAPLSYGEGNCKLLDIDEDINWSSNFHATWLGKMVSLRFRNEGRTIFVGPTSIHFEDGARAGYFNVFGLVEPGSYNVTCVGESGSVGSPISVTVSQ